MLFLRCASIPPSRAGFLLAVEVSQLVLLAAITFLFLTVCPCTAALDTTVFSPFISIKRFFFILRLCFFSWFSVVLPWCFIARKLSLFLCFSFSLLLRFCRVYCILRLTKVRSRPRLAPRPRRLVPFPSGCYLI